MMISIIVPYWNSEQWIDRCCDSMQALDGCFEFLLINDHSTDNGVEIVRRYADTDCRFKMLSNERNKGVSGARNTGIDHARGDWITFLDADDELTGSAARAFRKTIRSADANIHQMNHLRQNRRSGRLRDACMYADGWFRADNPPEFWFGIWNKLFRAEFIRNIRFDEALQYGEDGLFVLECFEKDPMLHHAGHDLKAVIHRFDNKQSLSHVKTAEDIIKNIKTYTEFLERQTDTALKKMICMELSKLWERTARRMA